MKIAKELIKRHQMLDAKMPNNSMLMVASGTLKAKTGSADYPFRASSNFLYLTGLNEAQSKVIFLKQNEKMQKILFVQERDAMHILFENTRIGVKKAQDLPFDAAYDVAKFAEIEAKLGVKKLTPLNESLVEELRLVKSDYEIKQMQISADITKQAFTRICSNLTNYASEKDILADIIQIYLKNEADYAYWPIVACGKNSTILHYQKSHDAITDEGVLIDTGAEYNSYATDVTRTIFKHGLDDNQALIYNIVKKVHTNMIAHVKPGSSLVDLDKQARSYMQEFLDIAGIKEPVAKVFPHSLGHHLGMDVHDCSSLNSAKIPLKPGMVITIEPGLYFLDGPYKNIGVRIEDDILVTETGNINLTKNIPYYA